MLRTAHLEEGVLMEIKIERKKDKARHETRNQYVNLQNADYPRYISEAYYKSYKFTDAEFSRYLSSILTVTR